MKGMAKKWLDGAEEGDERIRAGRERAGNAAFCAVMFLLWLAMSLGLVAGRTDMAVVPFAVFMVGGVFYLFLVVRNGAFESGKNRARGGKRNLLGYAAAGIVYAAVQFFFRIKDSKEAGQGAIVDSAIYACVGAAIWVTLFAALVAFLRKRSDKRNAEKM